MSFLRHFLSVDDVNSPLFNKLPSETKTFSNGIPLAINLKKSSLTQNLFYNLKQRRNLNFSKIDGAIYSL